MQVVSEDLIVKMKALQDKTRGVDIRVIPSHSNYGVSRDGRVWSYKTARWVGFVSPEGYHQVDLDGKHYSIHNLILETYIGPRPPGALGLHKDDDKDNNNLYNLMWGLSLDNTRQAIRNGKIPSQEGNGPSKSKLSDEEIRSIRLRAKEGEKLTSIAASYKKGYNNIWMIVCRRTYKGVVDDPI